MLDATDTTEAPWNIVINTDKRRVRLNCIAHLLDQIPYERVELEAIELPERLKESEYDDRAPMKKRNYVPDRF